jgi:hypothetical protein
VNHQKAKQTMFMHSRDDAAMRLRITEQLAVARTQAERLRPEDKELRGRLRQQLDEMLAELLAPKYPGRAVVEALPQRTTAPAARPQLLLRAVKKD